MFFINWDGYTATSVLEILMLCGDDAKITDFEYAKKMTFPGKVHEIRTVRCLLPERPQLT